jgi:hypothetical protein
MAFGSLFFWCIFMLFRIAELVGLWHRSEVQADVARVIEREAYLAETRRGMSLAVA